MKLELKCGPGDGEMFMLGKKRHDEGEVFGRRVPLRDINNPSMNTLSQFHSICTSHYKNRVLSAFPPKSPFLYLSNAGRRYDSLYIYSCLKLIIIKEKFQI